MRNLNRAAWFGIGLALGFAAKWAVGQTPGLELRAALADARTINNNALAYTRYVTAYNLKDTDAAQRTLNFVCNSVSRTATLRAVTPVAGSGGRLLRLDLAAFGIPHAAWESLTADDPYFKIKTQVIDPHTGKKKTVVTDGGWVNLEEAAALRQMTGSVGAICRLDWFIHRLMQPEVYYEWAGIPDTLDGWYKALGADRNTIINLKANYGANLIQSGVTRQTRRLSRYQGPHGVVTQTYDHNGKDADKDPIRNPSFAVNYTAGENIAAKANGTLIYGLYDVAGRRQTEVPPDIAKDSTDLYGDGRLRPPLSCISCHSKDNGIRKFENDQKKLFDLGIDVLTGDPNQSEHLASFYLSPKLQRDFERDRQDYSEAVKSVTGWTVQKTADTLRDMVDAYQHELVSPEKVKAETGFADLSPLRASRDGVLLSLLVGRSVQRSQFEASFPECMILLQSGGK